MRHKAKLMAAVSVIIVTAALASVAGPASGDTAPPLPLGQGSMTAIAAAVDAWAPTLKFIQRIPFEANQAVSLSGTGFTPSVAHKVQQCSPTACIDPGLNNDDAVSMPSSVNGAISGALRLRKNINGYICFFGGCRVKVSEVGEPAHVIELRVIMGRKGAVAVLGYSATVTESSGEICIPVVLSRPLRRSVTITFSTLLPYVPGIAATSGTDFVGTTSRNLYIPAGAQVACARITIVNDSVAEPTEALGISFLGTSRRKAMIIAGDSYSYGFVIDDD